MYAIMYAMNNNLWGHLVFIGDSNQLPSVSPGNFLSDIMSSDCVNVVKLDKVHRQSDKSYIPLLAKDVTLGKIITIPKDAADIHWKDLPSQNWNNVLRNFVNESFENIKGLLI
jgi:exodeoxyribonuclease V alpha subunit